MLDKIGVFRMGATVPSCTRYRSVFKSDKINRTLVEYQDQKHKAQ